MRLFLIAFALIMCFGLVVLGITIVKDGFTPWPNLFAALGILLLVAGMVSFSHTIRRKKFDEKLRHHNHKDVFK